MNHPSHSTEKVGVWVVDRQHLLRNRLCAGVPTDCSITAYEVHTSAEAVALAQEVQPDIVLIDLGVQGLSDSLVMHQSFTEHVPLDILVQTGGGCLREVTAGYEAHPSSVNQFVLALCQECSKIMGSEPDMIHQLFRTWSHHCLEPRVCNAPKHRELKFLVLTLPGVSSRGKSTWLDVAEERTRQFLLGRGINFQLFSWNSLHRLPKAHLSQLLYCARGWISRGWRAGWRLRFFFTASPSLDKSSVH